jgi:hypothetical protein
MKNKSKKEMKKSTKFSKEKSREKIKSGQLVVYAINECHLMGGDIVGEAWGKSKERMKIPINNYKDRPTYYGTLNLLEPDLILKKYSTGNGENTVKFV